MALLPPPSEAYETRKALVDAAQAWASTQGYAVTISRSNAKTGVVYLGRDRGGLYHNTHDLTDDSRTRDTGSRRIDRPFSIVGRQRSGIWTLSTRVPCHNHKASDGPDAHPSLRRLAAEQQAQLAELSQAMVKPCNIAIVLLGHGNITEQRPVTLRDVYNVRYCLRIESLAGQAPIHALFTQLSADNVKWEDMTTNARSITHLFFAPLLNIIGITVIGTMLYLAFTFLKTKVEFDFTWALE